MPRLRTVFDLPTTDRIKAERCAADFIADSLALGREEKQLAALNAGIDRRRERMAASLIGVNNALVGGDFDLDEPCDIRGEVFRVGEDAAHWVGPNEQDDDLGADWDAEASSQYQAAIHAG